MEKSRNKSHSSHSPTEESRQTRVSHQRRSRSRSHPSESRRSTRPSHHRSRSRSCHSRGSHREDCDRSHYTSAYGTRTYTPQNISIPTRHSKLYCAGCFYSCLSRRNCSARSWSSIAGTRGGALKHQKPA